MLKSVQIKIVLIFMILGILMIGIQGILFTSELEQIQQIAINNQDINQTVATQIRNTQILSIGLIIVFAIISIIVGIFVAKVIISPILKLTKNAESAAKSGKYQIKYLDDGKPKTEVDELAKAFNMMHSELNENLKEVSRQKIEECLLEQSTGWQVLKGSVRKSVEVLLFEKTKRIPNRCKRTAESGVVFLCQILMRFWVSVNRHPMKK